MIFVTVGSMFPFDRLVRLVDEWAKVSAPPGEELLAQIGNGSYLPVNMRWVRKLAQDEFSRAVQESRLVVSHAGMGSVITAGQYGRPIVMLPRLQPLGEHTTDHQIATANWLRGKPGIFIADSEAGLADEIGAALAMGGTGAPTLPIEAPAEFLSRIRQCILAPRV